MSALAGLVDKGLMAPDWAAALAPVDERIARMGQFLRDEVAAGRGYRPAGDHVFRAFQRPLADVRVLVVGQDPYPKPDHPIGLSFAVERHVWPLPPSLVNIYVELRNDLGIVPPRSTRAMIARSVTSSQPRPRCEFDSPGRTVSTRLSSITPWSAQPLRSPWRGGTMPRSLRSST